MEWHVDRKRFVVGTSPQLMPSLEGKRCLWGSGTPGVGRVCCYAADRHPGRPVVLLHDLGITSSALEMRPLFEALRWRRPTFAIDLPGFGLSDRPAVRYSPSLFAAVIEEILRKVRARHAAADVVTLGHSFESAARVARRAPRLVHSLVTIEPAGLFGVPDAGLFAPLAARLAGALGDAASRSLFALMRTRPMLERAARARFFGAVDAALIEHATQSTHAPGSYRAPLASLAARRCEPELRELFGGLTTPAMVVHDARGEHAVALGAFLRQRANRFAIRVGPTQGMPQFERFAETISALERFWQFVSVAASDEATR